MAPVFKAVVFDLDGTLVDSVELIALSFQHAIREVLHREASYEEAMKHVGTPLKEQMVRISPEHADELGITRAQLAIGWLAALSPFLFAGLAQLAGGVRQSFPSGTGKLSGLGAAGLGQGWG